MNVREIVSGYEAILTASRRMLDAARRSEWDTLVELEAQRSSLIRGLLQEDREDLGLAELNELKGVLIRAILECDEETGTLTKAWMNELRQILDSVGVERKLGDAYASLE